MQLSLPMQNKLGLNSNNIAQPGYITIDDAIKVAKELLLKLNQLGEYKHPLDVRRGREGVVNLPDQEENSKTLKAGSKTYFFDIKQTKDGKPYLVITESRFQGNGKSERSAIIVFQEQAKEFTEAVTEMLTKIEE